MLLTKKKEYILLFLYKWNHFDQKKMEPPYYSIVIFHNMDLISPSASLMTPSIVSLRSRRGLMIFSDSLLYSTDIFTYHLHQVL